MQLIRVSALDFQVSDEDYLYLNQWNWQATADKYAKRNEKAVAIYMHIAIAVRMGLSTQNEIDHKDLNPLNNQRANLRSATRSQNAANRLVQANNTSSYKGVYANRASATKHWFAKITVNGRGIYIGAYDCPRAAARAYNTSAKRMFGEFANVNPDVRCGSECLICTPRL